MDYILLVLGFIALIKGADWFVDGASSLARRLGVSAAVIGLTVVAMGTSAPEAAVSITAAVQGSNEIAVGNVIGSNLFNLLIVLGVCMIITAVPTAKEILVRDFPWNIAATVLLIPFILDGRISRIEGIILLILFVSYIGYVLYRTVKNRLPVDESEIGNAPLHKSILLLIIGIALVVAGGQLVVSSATGIATSWGVSETLIGLTVVAFGTSLPELVTSIVAAKKGEVGMAVGNVIGSNLFNLLFILGITTTIRPIAVESGIMADLLLLTVFTVMMFGFSLLGKKGSRIKGIVSVLCYAGYLAYIIVR